MKKVTVCLLILLCLAVLPVSAMAFNAVSSVEGAIKAVSKAPSSLIIQSKLSPAMVTRFESIGGKAMVAKAEKIASMYGASALKVVGNNPRLISVLGRFGNKDQSKLLNALSRKPDLVNAVQKYGDDILKLELRSNNQAMRIVRTFGAEGVRLGAKLTDKQLEALVLATNKFKNASPKVIKAFLDMVGKYTGKVFDFLEKHPKVLYTATAAGLVYNMKTEIFGNPEKGTEGALGHVIGHVTTDVLKPISTGILTSILPWVGYGLFAWICFSGLRPWFKDWLNRPEKPSKQKNMAQGKCTKSNQRFWFFKRKQDDENMIDAEVVNHG